jgi:hypothetical protein
VFHAMSSIDADQTLEPYCKNRGSGGIEEQIDDAGLGRFCQA